MKIAYCVQDYTKAGGIERSVRKLFEIFFSQGQEIYIIMAKTLSLPRPNMLTVSTHGKIRLPQLWEFIN